MTVAQLLENLTLSIPWIGQSALRIARLEALLIEADASCGSPGQDLVASLIRRFTFVTTDEYEALILEMAEYIATSFDMDGTLLCATTADRNKDSAQRVLYDLTSNLAALGLYKVRALNRYDALPKENNFHSVVLVDEFIGSGQSIVGRVKAIHRVFKQRGTTPPEIHALALVGMTVSLREIAHNFSSLNVCLALRKGIDQYTSGHRRADEYELMSTLESMLAPVSHGESLPSLGYAALEALYSRHAGSCPNNVFPVFWWPELLGPKPRQPLFPRAL